MRVAVDVLASFPLFERCAPEDLQQLADRLRHRSVEAGRDLMVEGESASEFALLLSGEATVTRGDDESLAVLRPGAVIGELALLRGAVRTATVTTTRASEFAVGDESDLEFLLDLPGAHDAVRDLASARLAQDVEPVRTEVRNDLRVMVRPLLPSDRSAYTAAVQGMSTTALRHRFFSAAKPSGRLLEYLVDIDYVDHFVWLVLLDEDPPVGIATGRYIRSSTGSHEAEVAYGIVDAYQGYGIGRLLVGAVAVAAQAGGISRLVADVMDDNEPMRALLNKAGAKFAFAEPGIVHTEFAPDGATELIDADLRDALRTASRDVVTAAGLALA